MTDVLCGTDVTAGGGSGVSEKAGASDASPLLNAASGIA